MAENTGGLIFDSGIFDRLYWEFDADIRQDHIEFVAVAPTTGFRSDLFPISLEPVLEVDKLTDDEINRCLQLNIFPDTNLGGTVYLVDPFGVRFRFSRIKRFGELSSGLTQLQAGQEDPASKIQLVSHCLRLFKSGRISIPSLATFTDQWPLLGFNAGGDDRTLRPKKKLSIFKGRVILARCKSWRDCEYCAWVYGRAVQKLWEQIRCVRAFVVFTMPPERGDWSNRENIRAQSLAKRRLAERLFRKFGHRFALAWAREHNTHGSGAGRLQLNVLWDENWVDQTWLSEVAEACGFGRIVNISRVGAGARLRDGDGRGKGVHRYALNALRYATKDAASRADWPKVTRRWGASRAARAQMKRPDRNLDWFWSPDAPPGNFMPFDVNRYKPARADGCLCCLCNGRSRHAGGLGCFACVCGAWNMAGSPRERLSRAELAERARASPYPSAA